MAGISLLLRSSRLPYFLLVMIGSFSFASSDFASDRAECADQLTALATCLTYVENKASAPTPDCCSGLEQVLAKSRKCLCVLIKDRDEPGLGIKINVTAALSLPSVCHASANISECPSYEMALLSPSDYFYLLFLILSMILIGVRLWCRTFEPVPKFKGSPDIRAAWKYYSRTWYVRRVTVITFVRNGFFSR